MASLLGDDDDFEWPEELREYDPAKWECGAAWRLARAAAAPSTLVWLNEIRASVGVPPLPVYPAGLTRAARALRRGPSSGAAR